MRGSPPLILSHLPACLPACPAHNDCRADHSYWGRPEDQTGSRPAFVWDASKPASDAASSAASALAAISLAFKPMDGAYAASCLAHARSLFAYASKVSI